ncbi:MAG: hypothetical protein QM638_18075, partial [Nocardioides sp.]|uniref:hypothetical protein n=1 Tax=Nocardioides sp. TaxID=35761 RepID=UPI0039E2A175
TGRAGEFGQGPGEAAGPTAPPPAGGWGAPAAPGGPGAPFAAPAWQNGPAPKQGGFKPWMAIVGGVVVLAIIAVVVVVLVTGGGGDNPHNASSAPSDASVSDFCDSVDWIESMSGTPSDSDLKGWQDDMRKVGTPSDMSSDARKGWEEFVNLDSVDAANDLDSSDSALTAFTDYVAKNCYGLG